MKAAVLYSGGKDSSFMAVMLKRLGLDVELCTANFGVYDSYIPASKSAKSLGFNHRVLDMDFEILDKTCDMIMNDGFPNDGSRWMEIFSSDDKKYGGMGYTNEGRDNITKTNQRLSLAPNSFIILKKI